MTKNTTGGKGHKKQASKGSNFVQRDYKITSPLEVEGYVEKILGNGMILVNSTNEKHIGLICTIRGKFKGRNKSRNRIETNGIVIVGLREWESPHKTADLLFVCNGKHKAETDEYGNDDGIDFIKTTGDDEISFENSNATAVNKSTEIKFTIDEEEDIDIYDKNDIDIDDI
jgi:translation initiation factor IF-1